MSFLSTIESAESKVVGFVAKEILAAESLLGAKTGSAKLNLVVTAVEAGLSAVGINVKDMGQEIIAVVNALVAVFNKAGILPVSTTT